MGHRGLGVWGKNQATNLNLYRFQSPSLLISIRLSPKRGSYRITITRGPFQSTPIRDARRPALGYGRFNPRLMRHSDRSPSFQSSPHVGTINGNWSFQSAALETFVDAAPFQSPSSEEGEHMEKANKTDDVFQSTREGPPRRIILHGILIYINTGAVRRFQSTYLLLRSFQPGTFQSTKTSLYDLADEFQSAFQDRSNSPSTFNPPPSEKGGETTRGIISAAILTFQSAPFSKRR
jgi:hypothetical protein